jgi:hypothetical protein
MAVTKSITLAFDPKAEAYELVYCHTHLKVKHTLSRGTICISKHWKIELHEFAQ